jgi:hypothetical protein
MSDAHDIEQIARVLWSVMRGPVYKHPDNELEDMQPVHPVWGIARAILPLLSAAEAKGAEQMRERAADEIHDHVAGTYEERIAIMCAIRALPIKEG